MEIDTIEELNYANLISTQYEVSNLSSLNQLSRPKILFTDFDGCLTNDKVKFIAGKSFCLVNG